MVPLLISLFSAKKKKTFTNLCWFKKSSIKKGSWNLELRRQQPIRATINCHQYLAKIAGVEEGVQGKGFTHSGQVGPELMWKKKKK